LTAVCAGHSQLPSSDAHRQLQARHSLLTGREYDERGKFFCIAWEFWEFFVMLLCVMFSFPRCFDIGTVVKGSVHPPLGVW